MRGYAFIYGGRDIFAETERRRRTPELADEILGKMACAGIDVHDCAYVREELMRCLEPAECEILVSPGGRRCCRIYGKGFDSGEIPAEDGRVVVMA